MNIKKEILSEHDKEIVYRKKKIKVWWKRWQTIAYCHFLLPLDTVQGGYHCEFQKPSQGISLWSYSCSISSSGLRPQLATTTMLKLQDSNPTACRGHCSWQLPSTKWWNFSREHSSVQLLSCIPLFVTPWTAAHQASLFITNSKSLLKLMSIESVIWSDHFILSRPLLLPLQSFPASGSFPVSQFFVSGDQTIGVSTSASVLPMNIQDWFL